MELFVKAVIIGACNLFWVWYLCWEQDYYRREAERHARYNRCKALGLDPREHGLAPEQRKRRWYEYRLW